MFKSIHRAIRREQAPAPVGSGTSIHEREQVVSTLVKAYKAHVLLDLGFPDKDMHFSTALLGIYDEHGFIVLDELTPRAGHDLLLKIKDMRLSGRLNGVSLKFSSQLLETREKSGVAYYKARLPDHIDYVQRRQHIRIMPTGNPISFHGLRGKGTHQIVKGWVHDLSNRGLGIVLEEDVTLYEGEVLPSCMISLPGEGEVMFSFEVRFVSCEGPDRVTRLGGCFKDIDPDSLRKFRRVLDRIERTQLVRSSGN